MVKVDSPTKQDFESMNLNGTFNHFKTKLFTNVMK